MPRVKLFDKNEVLSKAMHVFWKQGYSDTSIQDLVTCLGINRASLYDTFGDKEQLFKKAFELYRTSNIEQLSLFFQSHSNVKEGFSKLFDIAIQEALHDESCKGCFVVNTITERVPNDESILDVLEHSRQELEQIFYDYLKKGKENGQLKTRQDLKSLASFFYMIYNGLRVVSKVRPDEKELSDTIKVALSLLN